MKHVHTATIEHLEVYRKAGHFAGWPANYGIWSWGEDIVLGFTLGHMRVAEGLFHLRDTSRPFTTMQARSRDAGRTWECQPFPGATPDHRALSADEHMVGELGLEQALARPDCPNRPQPHPGGIDFTAPDFAFMAAKTGIVSAAGVRSFFYTSNDRCHTWDGPWELPMFGQTGVAARTDYLPLAPHDCLLFLTGNKADGSEGQVFCARTQDGGASFRFVSFIGPELHGEGWAIMPASLRLPDGEILVARRCGKPVGGDRLWHHWIDLYHSRDEGATWACLGTPVPNAGINGNPPTLNRLPDGRLCIIYGYRDKPHGIHAVLSGDDGRSWSDPIHLRDDGGAPDLGYPRTVVLDDGTVLTAYYFEDTNEGERYIAATRWKP